MGEHGVFEQAYFDTYFPDHDRKNPAHKLAHYRSILDRFAIPAEGPARVLDLGCAYGSFAASLDPSWTVCGTDVSEFAIAKARARVPHAMFAVMRDHRIPYDARFDAVSAWDVLEHIPDLDDIAEQVRAHLAAQGVFAFAVPVYDGPLGWLVDRLDRDVTHVHRLPRRRWLEWAARHFALVEWWGAFRLLLPGGYYIHWPSRALRAVSPALIAVARVE